MKTEYSSISCLVLIAAMLTGCHTQPLAIKFWWIPHRSLPGATLKNIEAQETVSDKKAPVRMLILGYGSGYSGYESIVISDEGKVEVVCARRLSGGKLVYYQANAQLPPPVTRDFLASNEIKDARTLGHQYSADIHDGAQGFLGIFTAADLDLTHLNNFFPAEYVDLHAKARKFVESSIPPLQWHHLRKADGFEVSKRLYSLTMAR